MSQVVSCLWKIVVVIDNDCDNMEHYQYAGMVCATAWCPLSHHLSVNCWYCLKVKRLKISHN